MVYQYRGIDTIKAEEERQQKLKDELAQERENLKEAMKIRRQNERIEAQILETQQRAAQLRIPLKEQPRPIHGGRSGLHRAALEAAAHGRRNKRKAA